MIRRLLYLNGLAAFSAVLYHATGWGFTAMFWWTDRYRSVSVPNFDQLGGASYFSIRAIEQLVIVAIPAFLFVSGFFVAFATGRSHRTVSWNIIGVRVKNIIIPYLVWSVVAIGMLFAFGERFSAGQIVKMLAFGETQPPYYYVPLLIQLYLLSPLVVLWAKSEWKSLLVVAALLQLLAVGVRNFGILNLDVPAVQSINWLGRSWFFPSHIFWFSAGIVVSFHLKPLKMQAMRFRWWLLAGTIIAYLAGIAEWEMLFKLSGQQWIASQETLVDGVYSIFFMLTFIGFDKMPLPAAKQIGDIGVKSFGIYLIHAPVLAVASKIIYHVAPWVLGYQILYQAILVALGLGIPLMLMWMVKKSPAHPYYQYLFG